MTSSIQTHKDLTNIGSGTIAAPTGMHDFQNGQRFYNRDDDDFIPELPVPDWSVGTVSIQQIPLTLVWAPTVSAMSGDGERILISHVTDNRSAERFARVGTWNGSQYVPGTVLPTGDVHAADINKDHTVAIVAYSDAPRIYSGTNLDNLEWTGTDTQGNATSVVAIDDVGATFAIANNLVTKVFTRNISNGNVSLLQSFGDGSYGYNSISLSGDGLTVLIGWEQNRVRVYRRPDTSSTFSHVRDIFPNAGEHIGFATATAINYDGTRYATVAGKMVGGLETGFRSLYVYNEANPNYGYQKFEEIDFTGTSLNRMYGGMFNTLQMSSSGHLITISCDQLRKNVDNPKEYLRFAVLRSEENNPYSVNYVDMSQGTTNQNDWYGNYVAMNDLGDRAIVLNKYTKKAWTFNLTDWV